MSVNTEMVRGYPSEADIITFLAARGIEIPTLDYVNFYGEFKQFMWGVINAVDFAAALGVYAASATTFNVRAGSYLYKGTVKTYAAGTAVDPTDNDTTYVWLENDNSIDSGINGDDWPSTEHVKLAEIDVDSDGVITAIRDLRGQSMLSVIGGLDGTDFANVGSNGGGAVIFKATLAAGSEVQIHNADAPYKYEVIDAWSIAKSTDAGTWKLTDGTNDITDAVAVTATDKTINRAGTIDDSKSQIAESGSLSAVGDGSLADVDIYVMAVRVA